MDINAIHIMKTITVPIRGCQRKKGRTNSKKMYQKKIINLYFYHQSRQFSEKYNFILYNNINK